MFDTIEQFIQRFFPEFSMVSFLQVMLVISAVLFFAGIILRIFCGQHSSLSKGVVAAMSILFIYVVAVAINIQNHYEIFTAALPFISLTGDSLSIMQLIGKDIHPICVELVRMIVLAFLVNLLEDLIPDGKGFILRYLLKCLVIICSMIAYLFVTGLLERFLPGVIVTYAPVILLLTFLALFTGSLLNWIVVGVLSLSLGPFGAICGFCYKILFDSLIGQKLFAAILTSLIMLVVVYFLNVAGYTEILLLSAEIAVHFPTLLMLSIVWILTILFL